MPCVGLIDSTGTAWRWEQIHEGEGVWNDPAPALLALWYPTRRTYAEVTATQIAGDLRQAILKDRIDYFEDPERSLAAAFGTVSTRFSRGSQPEPRSWQVMP